MRLQHLHLLLTIVQTGSLRASADILNVTQPALTKALRQLEEENRKLKQIVADLSLDKAMLQAVVSKKL